MQKLKGNDSSSLRLLVVLILLNMNLFIESDILSLLVGRVSSILSFMDRAVTISPSTAAALPYFSEFIFPSLGLLSWASFRVLFPITEEQSE